MASHSVQFAAAIDSALASASFHLNMVDLVWPAKAYLSSYVDALQRGWSPDNFRPQRAQDELRRIATDAERFLAEQVDREAKGSAITLPDGSTAPRLPGYVLWMWDGDFCGCIGLRWQPGTTALPPYCLGHVGYGVVPWKRQRGYAKRALQLLLPYARAEGLAYVELTTEIENHASVRVIEANGGVLIEQFRKPPAYGGTETLRYRIMLSTLGDEIAQW